MPQPSARARRHRQLPASALVLTVAACSTFSTGTTEFQADGTVLLKCKTSLPLCLERAEDACHGARYDVVSATDKHDYYGPSGVGAQEEVRSSQAVVRCGPRGQSLFGSGAGKDTAASPATDASPPPAPRACVPGATQICFGLGACRGGQSCLADGSGFGACACAPGSADAGSAEPPPP